MPKVLLDCSCGPITIDVNESWAPLGAARFLELVRQGFFNEVRFFRVVTKPRPFVVQFGINGNPDIAAEWRDMRIKDDPVTQSNRKGTLSFASAGPGTRTTQIFINLADNTFLDGHGFSPFARVIEGMEHVQAICDEYGESPDQHSIQYRGNAYLEECFPKLDYIRTATLIEE